jgi:hypothetical protein
MIQPSDVQSIGKATITRNTALSPGWSYHVVHIINMYLPVLDRCIQAALIYRPGTVNLSSMCAPAIIRFRLHTPGGDGGRRPAGISASTVDMYNLDRAPSYYGSWLALKTLPEPGTRRGNKLFAEAGGIPRVMGTAAISGTLLAWWDH